MKKIEEQSVKNHQAMVNKVQRMGKQGIMDDFHERI